MKIISLRSVEGNIYFNTLFFRYDYFFFNGAIHVNDNNEIVGLCELISLEHQYDLILFKIL